MNRLVAALIGALVLLASCGDGTAIPAEAIEPFAIEAFRDPAAFDDVLAEAERQRNEQLVVVADISACGSPVAWALPEPDRVLLRFPPTKNDCEAAFLYRAIFLVPETGSGPSGVWDYRDRQPPVAIEPTP